MFKKLKIWYYTKRYDRAVEKYVKKAESKDSYKYFTKVKYYSDKIRDLEGRQ